MTFGSLFAGIGGFDLGLERAGMTCKWQCEIDKHANVILNKHWPNVPKYPDVRKIGGSNLEPVDLICGGFPCQDLSLAGNRAGLAGQRSGLFFEATRIIKEVKPAWYIIENVPGLLSSNGGKDFETVINELAECGYFSAWRVFDSQFFGVAQRRKRVFIVGSFRNTASVKVLFDECRTQSLVKRDDKKNPKITTMYNTLDVKNGKQEIQDGTCYTLTTKQAGIILDETRYLTPIEFERLQGFPDNWTEGISDTQRYKTLGNAVTVNVIEWIGKRIINAQS